MNYICDFKKSFKKSLKGVFLLVVIEENKSYLFYFLIRMYMLRRKKRIIFSICNI